MEDNSLMGILVWVVGVIVALAVGSGMINNILSVPGIPAVITIVAGWIVVVGAKFPCVEWIWNIWGCFTWNNWDYN